MQEILFLTRNFDWARNVTRQEILIGPEILLGKKFRFGQKFFLLSNFVQQEILLVIKFFLQEILLDKKFFSLSNFIWLEILLDKKFCFWPEILIWPEILLDKKFCFKYSIRKLVCNFTRQVILFEILLDK